MSLYTVSLYTCFTLCYRRRYAPSGTVPLEKAVSFLALVADISVLTDDWWKGWKEIKFQIFHPIVAEAVKAYDCASMFTLRFIFTLQLLYIVFIIPLHFV